MPAPTIEITADGLFVDGHVVEFPAPTGELVERWGPAERWAGRSNDVLIWHDLGLYAHAAGDDHVKTLCLQFQPEPDGPEFLPRSTFEGTFRVDGVTVTDRMPESASAKSHVAGTEKHAIHAYTLHASYLDGTLESVEITSTAPALPPVPRDRYEIRRSAGEPLHFHDVNLKLAVIDELMYQQEVIQPAFSLSEFVRWFDGRTIDIEREGGRPIPEVVEYFRRLEIDTTLAGHVRELTIDAGNEIYQNVAPQWNGEDDTFDIGAWDDVALLPNLQYIDFISMTPDEATIQALRQRDIEVDD